MVFDKIQSLCPNHLCCRSRKQHKEPFLFSHSHLTTRAFVTICLGTNMADSNRRHDKSHVGENQESPFYNPHSTILISQSLFFNPHSTIPILQPHSTILILQSPFHNPHSTIPIPQSLFYNPHSTILIPQSPFHNLHSMIFISQSPFHNLHSTISIP